MSLNCRKPLSLEIVSWNAQGLHPKRDELQEYVDRNHVDVVLVNETQLSPVQQDPRLRGYMLYRTDRQGRRGGGTAIYVKRDIMHSTIRSPETENIEATGIRVEMGTASPLLLYAVYCPPQKLLLDDDLNALLDTRQSVVVAGDLNAKHNLWNSRVCNRNGKILFQYVAGRDIAVIGPLEPTHYGTIGRPDVLDIAIMSNTPYQYQISTVSDLSSDHNPVHLHLGGEIEWHGAILKKTNWQLFQGKISEFVGKVPRIGSIDELERAVQHMETAISTALESSTREVDRNHMQDLPDHVRDLLDAKRRARRRYQRTLAPADRFEANYFANQVK